MSHKYPVGFKDEINMFIQTCSLISSSVSVGLFYCLFLKHDALLNETNPFIYHDVLVFCNMSTHPLCECNEVMLTCAHARFFKPQSISCKSPVHFHGSSGIKRQKSTMDQGLD